MKTVKQIDHILIFQYIQNPVFWSGVSHTGIFHNIRWWLLWEYPSLTVSICIEEFSNLELYGYRIFWYREVLQITHIVTVYRMAWFTKYWASRFLYVAWALNVAFLSIETIVIFCIFVAISKWFISWCLWLLVL